jgi:uncharacterized surface protein with fasciclin (FAS1) repeats
MMASRRLLLREAAIIAALLNGLALVASFRPTTTQQGGSIHFGFRRDHNGSVAGQRSTHRRRERCSFAAATGKNDIGEIQAFLESNYPEFYGLVENNEGLWKNLGDAETFTLFAPNAGAFAALGEAKRRQLDDPRNGEAREKVGLYHCVGEAVSADDLFNSGGVITLGGTVPVERTKAGGMFGVGGKEDGGVTVGGSRVVLSTEIGTGVVHETDGLVSPAILWRYVDQLRIPGSK